MPSVFQSEIGSKHFTSGSGSQNIYFKLTSNKSSIICEDWNKQNGGEKRVYKVFTLYANSGLNAAALVQWAGLLVTIAMENISLVGSFKVHCDPTSSYNVRAQRSATLQSRQLLHRPFCRGTGGRGM